MVKVLETKRASVMLESNKTNEELQDELYEVMVTCTLSK